MSKGLKIYWFIHNNLAIFACFITVFYWNVIYDGRVITLSNVLTHVTNVIGPMFDLFIVAHPHHISHCIYPMICGFSYLTFSFIYQACGGLNEHGKNYVYAPLDWKGNPRVAFIVGIIGIATAGVLHIIFYIFYLIKVRVHKLLIIQKSNENCIEINVVSTQQ